MESSELMCLLMCFCWHRHQKFRFKQWERRAPATAERRAAAAALGSEAGAVLQSEISTERTHQNGKNQEERQTPYYFPQISPLVGGCFFWRHETLQRGGLTSVLLCDVAIRRQTKIHFFGFLQLTERLNSLAEESHNIQMKKLKDICDK